MGRWVEGSVGGGERGVVEGSVRITGGMKTTQGYSNIKIIVSTRDIVPL